MDEDSYEDLTECGLSQELEDKLLYSVRNCVFMWTNAKGEPFGVVMSYLPKDGKLWLTAAERRKRIPALRRFPRASICISGAGTPLGSGRTVTYKGSVVIHDDRETADRETRDWFYPGFSTFLRPGGSSSSLGSAVHEVESHPSTTLSSVSRPDDDPVPSGLRMSLDEAFRVLEALEDARFALRESGLAPGLQDELATVIRIIHGKLGIEEGGVQ